MLYETRKPSARISEKTRLARAQEINEAQKSVILGSLLGDAYLCAFRRTDKMCNWAVTHSEHQLAYLEWKQEILSPIISRGPVLRERTSSGKKIRSFELHTVSHPYFDEIAPQWYPDGGKVVPDDVAEWLNPLALSVWFMDDGWREGHRRVNGKLYKAKNVYFGTYSFSDSDLQRLIEALERYQVEAVPIPRGKPGQKVLKLDNDNSHRFFQIISAHIIPLMGYKLDIS